MHSHSVKSLHNILIVAKEGVAPLMLHAVVGPLEEDLAKKQPDEFPGRTVGYVQIDMLPPKMRREIREHIRKTELDKAPKVAGPDEELNSPND